MLKNFSCRCLTGRRAAALCLHTRPSPLVARTPLFTPCRFGSSVTRHSLSWPRASATKKNWRVPPASVATGKSAKKRQPATRTGGLRKKSTASKKVATTARASRTPARKAPAKSTTGSKTKKKKKQTAPRKVKKLSPYERQTVKYNQRMARIEDLYKDYKRSASRGNTW